MTEHHDRAEEILACREALAPFFELDLDASPPHLHELLEPILQMGNNLARPVLGVTFFGAVNAGKSTLINALLGIPLLPTHANRATGVVTRIQHGPHPLAGVLRRGSDGIVSEQAISLDEISRFILLDLVEGRAVPPEGIEEVTISLPVPLLELGCIFVDTPGLFEQPELTDRAFRELEQTDLAIMVLSADKVLSAHERDAARTIHRLLDGNLVYVINRLNMVDEEDREDVLDWTNIALHGLGNELVGKPRIFATAAGGTGRRVILTDGLEELKEWLEGLLSSRVAQDVALSSRLGILGHHLIAVRVQLQSELEDVHHDVESVQNEEAPLEARERDAMRQHIGDDRRRLRAVGADLPARGEAFIQSCLTFADQDHSVEEKGRGHIEVSYHRALQGYVRLVHEATVDAVCDSQLSIPEFSPSLVLLDASVHVAPDILRDMAGNLGEIATRILDGGEKGREAGSAAGGWLARNVFKVDPDHITRARVESAARAVLPTLQAEAESYLQRVDKLLSEADTFYAQWSRTSPRLLAVRRKADLCAALLIWCERFLQAVQSYRPQAT